MHKTKSETSLVDTNDNNYKVFSTKTSADVYRLSNGDVQCHVEVESDHEAEKPVFDNYSDSSEDDNKTFETELSTPCRRQRDVIEEEINYNQQNNHTEISDTSVVKSKIRPHNSITINRLWHRHRQRYPCSDDKTSLETGDSNCMQCKPKDSFPRARFGTWPVLTPHKHFKYRSLDNSCSKRNKSSSHLSQSQATAANPCHCHKLVDRQSAPLLTSFTVPEDSPDYYRSALKMKDNRVKSTIRRHAIAKYRRHSSSMFDGCAIDALNKEDLLVMWKKSEIELQTKLNRVTLQNAHLKRLLRIVKDSESSDKSKDATITCTKL